MRPPVTPPKPRQLPKAHPHIPSRRGGGGWQSRPHKMNSGDTNIQSTTGTQSHTTATTTIVTMSQYQISHRTTEDQRVLGTYRMPDAPCVYFHRVPNTLIRIDLSLTNFPVFSVTGFSGSALGLKQMFSLLHFSFFLLLRYTGILLGTRICRLAGVCCIDAFSLSSWFFFHMIPPQGVRKDNY